MRTLKIDISLVKASFQYSKTTGKLKWLVGKFAGEEAGTINGCGYRIVEWLGKKWYAHRLAVALVTGQDPEGLVVDHTDYDRQNNTWKNLRLCTQRENLLRKRSSGRQTLRYRGIEKRLYSFGWRYRAVLVVDGRKIYGKPAKTQKAAYRKYLQLFAKHNGVKNMCPKMLTDYTTR